MANVDHADWVRARADCTDEDILENILKVVRADVRKFNALNEKQRRDRHFVVTDPTESPHRVYRAHAARIPGRELIYRRIEESLDDHIQISLYDEGKIGVSHKDKWSLIIHSQWNPDTLTCDLFIDDDEHPSSLHQISQRILGDFLFQVP